MSPSIKKGTAIKRSSAQFCKPLTEAVELAKLKVCTESVLKLNEWENKNKDTLSSKCILEDQLNNDLSLRTSSNNLLHIEGTNHKQETTIPDVPSPTTDAFKISIEPVMKIASEAPKMMDSNKIEESRIDFTKICPKRKLFNGTSANCILENEEKNSSSKTELVDKTW